VLYGDKTPLRIRVSIALIAFYGVMLEVLGNYSGIGGLRIKDLPELELKDKTVAFSHIPTLVVVREELNKVRHRYPTFIGEKSCELLKQFLERRINQGETLTPESSVIPTLNPRGDRRPTVRGWGVTRFCGPLRLGTMSGCRCGPPVSRLYGCRPFFLKISFEQVVDG
jgi:hypothetical protein